MAHDPKAPQLAAMATLFAATGLLVTAINLNLTLFGSQGLTVEEHGLLAGVTVMLVVRWLANREREVPEFNPRNAQTNESGPTTVSLGRTASGTVSPTTASILTSILGTTSTQSGNVNEAMASLGVADSPQPSDRITDLSASSWTYQTEVRPANPTQPEDGQSVQRLPVQPVPLPGQAPEDIVDPTTLPGLEPSRVFVTEGVASVPLPSSMTPPAVHNLTLSSDVQLTVDPPPPPALDLPSIDSLFTTPSLDGGSPTAPRSEPSAAVDLPSLDDLFAESNPAVPLTPASPSPGILASNDAPLDLPALPDLDDMFTNA